MAYLEIGLESSGVSLGSDPNRVIAIDYEAVTTALKLADRAAEDESATPAVKELADAVRSLSGVVMEIVRGLDHGRITVHNYPATDAHLEK